MTLGTGKITAAFLALALAGCASASAPPEDARSTYADLVILRVIDEGTIKYFNTEVGDRVLFDYDRWDLDELDRGILARQALWLNTYREATAVIEGHADERGTRDYNLALGERRANSARNYLVREGVAEERLSTVTYGKERPALLCSEERCWNQNRRAVTVVSGVPAE
jgi:peptidoglycan-associated lipoprotein